MDCGSEVAGGFRCLILGYERGIREKRIGGWYRWCFGGGLIPLVWLRYPGFGQSRSIEIIQSIQQVTIEVR